ncbi:MULTISPECIES: 2-polyprenylphenol 6-hydroxylase [unclassified Devosia]|uniref:2-polyprenylphenol 6-hydroxylase n=1 Tax=unclassified Devosia TaxID=196773 RepID=UPI00145F13E1|nr:MULTISPECIES: 2-polyprenylphenol 6-hydroxylase [unclassified Devosia]MBJ6987179.1 2-polyprenylphenol 6-hydroxylase [Devosia sp. MC521]QMW62793.1 2-polyprenylphenol 6-hydroxylase [Devosia sp. MC521]
MALTSYFRLLNAGWVLAREGALSVLPSESLPPMMRLGIRMGRIVERPSVRKTGSVERLNAALHKLGPSFVKFGQTLATRPDIVGAQAAAELSGLQDRMPAFDEKLVPGILSEALGPKANQLTEMSGPIAAASIAQVHRAKLVEHGELPKTVAVKMLRPGVSERFHADTDALYAGARLAETFSSKSRRLRPTEVVKTLDHSMRLELDLRLEAAAISEMAENIKDDAGFQIPDVQWDHVAQNVLTTTWVDGIPIRDHAAIDAAGIDRKKLASNVLQSFLRHAIRDGFFHADMHPGNLFADPKSGDVIAVDFGIMGRLSMRERRFLADILYGFITRDYRLVAQRHFDIGYVPPSQSVDDFTLAIRSIGEPLHGRTAENISMARVLGQLFTITDLFQMQTRPELVLLQKSMVLVEGVARTLDPELDIWTVAEPVVGDWLRREQGPIGRLEDLYGHFTRAYEAAGRVPNLIAQAEATLEEHRAFLNRPHNRLSQALSLGLQMGGFILILVLIGHFIN